MTSVFVGTLRKAAEILGSKAELRAWLRVSTSELETWMDGAARPPAYIFLKVVDLISSESGRHLPEEVRRSQALRQKAGLIQSAALATRERSAAAIARSMEIHAALLEQREPLEVVRRRSMTAASFAALGASTWDRHIVLGAALNAAVNDTSAARGNIQIVCPEGLRIAAQLGFRSPFLEYFSTVDHKGASCCGRAFEGAQRVLVPEVLSNPIFRGTAAADVMEAAGALAVQSTPLRGVDGDVIGMLSTHHEKPHDFSPQELEAVDLIARRTSSWLNGLIL